ncbi:50S ribosomal protein L2 [bacterium]|jgi:large subunit ribosomal protein L2|nr:50S ribosomal protein L2 [bacterium]MBT3903516.1 50S ribosomal protein L2 [bacterium]MBT5346112.1 50S ribosomal protein L2 [bacterium]MBT6131381.1 50S ribosomal protein L2 [bacterium]MBT6529159.1 50S ribosomal protein L2 [bacterium]
MSVKLRKPRTPSQRFQSYIGNEDITRKKPLKSLVVGLRKTGGRNVYGRITVRHRGGGARRLYRVIDFHRSMRDVPGRIDSVEYDPNRSVRIALVVYANGAKRYILLPQGVKVGDTVIAGQDVEAKTGNCLPLKNVPVGFLVHNIEMRPKSGGALVRSAGTSAQLIGKGDKYCTVKMPSGEVRMIHLDCWATVGVLGNADVKNISIGKAGRKRHMGIRPTVRGMAMNPIDHPHGGGEGRSKSGSHPTSPWGQPCKGYRTRKKNKRGASLIIRRRKAK